jgi:hypothetical protein
LLDATNPKKWKGVSFFYEGHTTTPPDNLRILSTYFKIVINFIFIHTSTTDSYIYAHLLMWYSFVFHCYAVCSKWQVLAKCDHRIKNPSIANLVVQPTNHIVHSLKLSRADSNINFIGIGTLNLTRFIQILVPNWLLLITVIIHSSYS